MAKENMRAARLRHRVELQKATTAKDGHGQEIKTWATQATVSAGIEPIKGKEFVERDVPISEVDSKIVIRYYAGITPLWRVKFGAKIYEIKSIIMPNMIKREINLMAKEIPSGSV